MIIEKIAGILRRKHDSERRFLDSLPCRVLCQGEELPRRLPLNVSSARHLPGERMQFVQLQRRARDALVAMYAS